MNSKITAIILISGTAISIVANIILIATGNTSMSQTIQSAAGKYPLIPLALGIVLGHWFWPVNKK